MADQYLGQSVDDALLRAGDLAGIQNRLAAIYQHRGQSIDPNTIANLAQQLHAGNVGWQQIRGIADVNTQKNVMPYDPTTAPQELALMANRNSALDKITQARQTLAENTTNQERALSTAQPDILRNLLDSFAGRGMAQSSGYGYGYGRAQQNLADKTSALERALQEGNAGYDQATQDANQQYQQNYGSLESTAANNLAAQAGNLGLGAAPPSPAVPKPPAKLVAKAPAPTKPTAGIFGGVGGAVMKPIGPAKKPIMTPIGPARVTPPYLHPLTALRLMRNS